MIRRHRTAILVTVLVIAAAIFGLKEWLYSRNHVTTDNAQIDGRLAAIAPRISGYVAAVRVNDNEHVAAGDTLVILQTADLDAAVAQAGAALAAARAKGGSNGGGELAARLAAAKATALASEAAIARARANSLRAAADLERMKTLAAKQIVPAQQLDAAQAAATAAAAELDAALRDQGATEAGVGVARAAESGGTAAIKEAEAKLEAARLRRSWAVLTAPIAGIVSHRAVDPGALLQPGQTAMMVVPENADIWVTANVKETEMGDVAVGDTVDFTVDSYGGRHFAGRVESIAPATGARFALLPPDNATGNFTKVVQNVPVRIRILTPPDPEQPLRPGMSVKVAITTEPAGQ